MAKQFLIDLGHVVDREGEKIAVSIQSEQWADGLVYGIAFNQLNNPNELFVFGSLFNFLLKGEEKDFKIISETRLCEPTRISAKQIRKLVRRILGSHKHNGDVYTVRWDGSVLHEEWRLVPVDDSIPF